MIVNKSVKFLFTGALLVTLAGCFGSSNTTVPAAGGTPPAGGGTGGTPPPGGGAGGTPPAGGGGTPPAGGGGTPPAGTSTLAEFNTKATNYIFLAPTSTPITGVASYKGEVSVLTGENAADPAEAVIGDLDLNVNFGAGVTNPVSGTAGNFAGKVDGVDTQVTGTLRTANAIAGDVNTVTATTTPAATITGLTATLRGDISLPNGDLSGNARMILGGTMMEAGGAKISGGHQTTIFPTGGGTSIATGGSIWADRQ